MDEIKCTRCEQVVPGDDVDLDQAIATCKHCDAVFDISSQLGRPAPRRPLVPLPAGMRVLIDEREVTTESAYRSAPSGKLVVQRRWRESAKLRKITVVGRWVGLLVLFVVIAVSNKPGAWKTLGPISLVAVVVGASAYALAAALFNTTRIAIEDDALVVRHRPLPWLGNHSIPIGSIGQLFTGSELAQTNEGRPTRIYDLSVILRDGRRVKVLHGLAEMNQALFLEQAIEERLGIVDMAVAGEASRTPEP